MKAITRLILIPVVAFGLSACDVQKTQEGKAPDVDVQGGQMPKYDVDAADVDVGTQERQVTVPTVDIDTPSEQRAEEQAGKE